MVHLRTVCETLAVTGMAAAGQGWAMMLTAEKEGQAASVLLHQDVSRNLNKYLNFFGDYHCILILLNTLLKL